MAHGKTDQFILIPRLAQYEIFDALTLKEKATLVRVSRSYYSIFQNEIRALKLLQFITRGQRRSAEQLLIKHPELISIRTHVTDCSERRFEKITAFEYAFWAKDIFTCRMLLKYMDEKTKKKHASTCKTIASIGLSFEQHGQVFYNSRHYDFDPLLAALRRCVEVKDDSLIARVGASEALHAAQMDVPIHVVQEYVKPDRSFDPLPSFAEEILFEASCHQRMIEWFPKHFTKSTAKRIVDGACFGAIMSLCVVFVFANELGASGTFLLTAVSSSIGCLAAFFGVDLGEKKDPITLAFVRGHSKFVRRLYCDFSTIQLDLNAISHLNKVRTADLAHLLESLNLIEPKLVHDAPSVQDDFSKARI